MKYKNTPFIVRAATVLLAFFLFTILSGTIVAQTRQLPLEFFTDKLPPTRVQVWTDPVSGNSISIDAYNKRNTTFNLGLPTTREGRVMIQPLKDNMERVTVEGHTRNALCIGFTNPTPNTAVVLFGYGLAEVLNQVGPASLGDVNYRIVFAPRPSDQPFIPNGALEFFSASINCDGLLRAASGFDEGTPGFAQTRQTGLYNTKAGEGCPPEKDGDCFPAEKVQFKRRGQ
jgi:hypothetical protein